MDVFGSVIVSIRTLVDIVVLTKKLAGGGIILCLASLHGHGRSRTYMDSRQAAFSYSISIALFFGEMFWSFPVPFTIVS